jgi:hypothetical protein
VGARELTGEAPTAADAPDDAAAVAYFRAVEDAFVRERGAPLLLSPADFQVAARWQQEGVPLGLVLATIEEVFAQRRARGAKGRINSLRYCAPAVDAAWGEVRELQGPGRREAPPELAVPERLEELAAGLPEFPGRGDWAARLRGLSGAPEAVEEALRGLDGELLAALAAGLSGEERERLEAEVEAILDGLRDRFPDRELEGLAQRLFAQRLRRLRAVPVLSLF